MKWIEHRIEERAEKDSRRKLIESSISDIWQNLCAAISDSVSAYKDEAARLGEGVRTNGQAYVTSVVYLISNYPVPGVPLGKMTATLDRNNAEITVVYEGKRPLPQLVLSFDVHSGAPCLFRGGTPLTAEGAAEMVLSPFLFPDLK